MCEESKAVVRCLFEEIEELERRSWSVALCNQPEVIRSYIRYQ
jgi:hypothetical protein